MTQILLASDLNRRIIILRAALIDDGHASVPGVPAEIGRRWAKRTDISDGERVRASQQGQDLKARFLVRSDSLTRTVTGKDVLQCDGESFEVVGTKEWGGRGVGIEITTAAAPDTP